MYHLNATFYLPFKKNALREESRRCHFSHPILRNWRPYQFWGLGRWFSFLGWLPLSWQSFSSKNASQFGMDPRCLRSHRFRRRSSSTMSDSGAGPWLCAPSQCAHLGNQPGKRDGCAHPSTRRCVFSKLRCILQQSELPQRYCSCFWMQSATPIPVTWKGRIHSTMLCVRTTDRATVELSSFLFCFAWLLMWCEETLMRTQRSLWPPVVAFWPYAWMRAGNAWPCSTCGSGASKCWFNMFGALHCSSRALPCRNKGASFKMFRGGARLCADRLQSMDHPLSRSLGMFRTRNLQFVCPARLPNIVSQTASVVGFGHLPL